MKVTIFLGLCLFLWPAFASPDTMDEARSLYEHTDYHASLRVLAAATPDAAGYVLTGKNHFMLGEYSKAAHWFEKAVALSPRSSECELWLGRAYGRRAETGAVVLAPLYASKARQHFEKAAALDPHDADASNDLFDYYLNAPEILGGGLEKAEAIARRIATERPAESHFERAQIAERRKQYAEAEAHLRRAVDLAPGQAGRVLDLARYLARRGRIAESDALFAQARATAPNDPRVAFARAKTYCEQRRNQEETRRLLREYLASALTPDDPPKADAEKLMRQAAGE
ncbi:MAG TPA: tetratricopeptide repeat protein [Candidatus Sulfopaludibacter sp.]|nr:tetratricopeptide repeat protein [Candidatus Sulfopaludibacter sp.]